ncbi:hypothetical protein A3709_01830 [Halioglobus sp. HI00S01]|uniref:hypothetical protein n=1 Tax=Halioglobus sp. HI00S01 TaxID=1822214 RepID=UPI0007C3A7A8|nr:hypothetical protein [Halioglobus sp. HI00S01]KZX58229.1 hypothetical protein A3709_01830 [Halioglobus sp. HI00S01]
MGHLTPTKHQKAPTFGAFSFQGGTPFTQLELRPFYPRPLFLAAGTGPVFNGDTVYMNSGYGIYFHMPGNVLLAYELAPPAAAAD